MQPPLDAPPDAPQSLKALAILVAFGLMVVPAAWLFLSLRSAEGRLEASASKSLNEGTSAANANEAPRDAPVAGPPDAAAAPPQRPPAPASAPTPEPAWRGASTPADRKLARAHSVELSEPERSRSLLRQALELSPKNERALRMLAAKMLVDEKHAEAAQLSERCLELNPTNYACARVKEDAVKMEAAQLRAIQATEDCLRKDPNALPCLYAKLNFALVRGKVREAQTLAEQVARIDPRSPITLTARARLEAASGHYGEARVRFESACRQGFTVACFRAESLRGEGF
ncbi:MAG TPA: hypothetical protein VK524_01190 [Polyangiaceae bacterium]|nr:hypothetical protein [Polyangiaceae bacterium]